MKEGKLKRTIQLLPGAMFILLGWFYDFYIYINPGKWYVDDEMAPEMVLSNILNQEGTILSKNWVYSTELRVLCQHWFLRVGLLLYPNNWHRARIIGGLLMIVLASFIFIAFFSVMEMPLKWSLIASAVMIWPFGRDYYMFVIWGLFYLSHIMLLGLGFFLFIKLLNSLAESKKVNSIFLMILNVLLAFVNGLGGIRMTYVFYVPLFITFVLVLFINVQIGGEEIGNITKLKETKAVILSLLLAVVDIIGFFVNTFVLTKIYTFANLGMYFAWKEEFDFSLEEILRNYVFQFGYQREAHVLTFEGISTVFGLLFAFVVIVCSIRLLFRFRELSFVQRVVVIFYHCTFLIHLVMLYCFAGSSNYWLTVLPFAIAVLFLELKSEHFALVLYKKCAVLLLTVTVICCSISTVRTQSTKKIDKANQSVYVAAKWLVDNGYTEGYSGSARNSLTEFSNGVIKVWPVALEGATSVDLIPGVWCIQKEMLTTKPEGKCFIFHYSVVDGPIDNCPLLKNGTMVFKNGYYTIWVYDSVEDIVSGL